MATETIELRVISPSSAPRSTSPFDGPGNTTAASPSVQESSPESSIVLGRSRGVIVVAQLSSLAFITSFGTGIITIGIPAIAASLKLDDSLLLWPYSVYYLTNGSCLLLGGAIADAIGSRTVNLIGTLLLATFILACGLARTGLELIMFRAIQGLAGAFVVPSSISIVSTYMPSGRPRNMGFACIGLAMPMGFSCGLVLGGVLVDTIGWRAGFYIGGVLSYLMFLIGIWALPAESTKKELMWQALKSDVDWVGAIIASASLAMLSYVFAILSADITYIKRAESIALLSVSLLLIVAFVGWMQYQVKHNRPALIPNSLWRNAAFSSVCMMVLLCIAVQNAMEQFTSLFFQKVQGTTALGASVRILPSLIVAVILNFATGMLVNRVPLTLTIILSTALCAGAPLLMAVINPHWSYWEDAFIAQLLAPLSGDILFTVGVLIVSDVFPARDQALAGAVFNTFSQLGASIGVSTMSVISVAVSKDSEYKNKQSPEALLVGYRATFWFQFALMGLAVLVGVLGLRKLGSVGVKRD